MSTRDETPHEPDSDILESVSDVQGMVETQLDPLGLRLPPEDGPGGADRVYNDNETLWKGILEERLRARVTITLQDFYLTEWYPRAPGLYWTEHASWARYEAQQYLLHQDPAYGQNVPRREGRTLRVFDPYGKGKLLDGGYGCLRLQPQPTPQGELWFWCASSSTVTHQGFPVALSDDVYDQVIDEVSTNGFARCTLIGKLQFLPDTLFSFLRGYRDVPRLYLLVNEIRPPATQAQPEKSISVTGAVSFVSNYEGETQVYASLVTFYPQKRESLDEASDWLEDVYVQGMYQGKILTDYDQHTNRFADAAFSLDRVLRVGLDARQIETLVKDDPSYELRPLEWMGEKVSVINQFINEQIVNTDGGANIKGNVNIRDGDFVSRDKIDR